VDFDEFTRTGLRPLLQFTRVLTGNRALAEDIVQEILIRLHARGDQLEEIGQVGAYTRRMAVNEYLGWRRKWFRQRPTAAPPEPAPQPDHSDRLAERDWLRGELARLPRPPPPGTSTRPAPRPSTLPSPLGQQLRFTAALGPVSGYNTTTDGVIFARFERFAVLLAPNRMHGRPAGTVTVYHPGAYDPGQVMRGQRVTVESRPAYYTLIRDRLDPRGAAAPIEPTLAWQVSDGRWIVVRSWPEDVTNALHLDPLNEERRVAAAVDTSASKPLRLPFRISYLPQGLTCVDAAAATTSPHPTAPPMGAELYLSCPGKPELDIQFGLGTFHTPAALHVNGHPAVLLPGWPSTHETTPKSLRLTIDLGNKHSLTLGGGYPEAELVKIAKSITLAPDLDHPSKWFDATK
jgi:Sigma-70 region 2